MKASAIDDTAADWVARLDAGPLPPELETALDHWLAQDPRHAGAYARARAVFLHADRASALGPDYDPRQFQGPGMASQHQPRRAARIALAGVAVLLLSLGLGYDSRFLLPTRDFQETTLGEVRRLPLSDGSVMTLNTASKARIEMSGDTRLVRLIEGEALFDVAKDPARPFVVEIGNTRVRAIGTSFSVRRMRNQGVEVLVREGVVRVERPGQPASAPPLAANMRAVAVPGRALEIERIAGDEVAQHLTWRDGMIAFDGDTLAEAAAEFSRYSATRILIADERIANMRVIGLYAANDPGGFADAVAVSFGLASEEVAGGVRLRSREDR